MMQLAVQGPHSLDKVKAYQRLKAASQDLADAIAEQKEQMQKLQGNLTSLDDALDRVSDSMMRATATEAASG
jgi:uncharacterized coiled-coil protein SlyX